MKKTATYIALAALATSCAFSPKASMGGDGGEVKSNIERSQIQRYRRALTQLRNTVGKFGFEMRARTVFKLVDRLLAMEKVSFKGEPLRGLQIMGMLETRAIDFRHLVVLSLND